MIKALAGAFNHGLTGIEGRNVNEAAKSAPGRYFS
jgi:hypothetical protein